MGKNRKKRRRRNNGVARECASSAAADSDEANTNPLWHQQRKFLESLSKEERDNFFSTRLHPDRRAELWMNQATVGETLINNFSWATPDSRCLRILKDFQPIIEIGCGANAYWSRCMLNAGIDVVAYDAFPETGGILGKKADTNKRKLPSSDLIVQQGGPEVLKTEHGRTLFLCYPDENDQDQVAAGECEKSSSMGAACLHFYTGEYVVHVGEVFGDTVSVDQAPWGRSSSPEFLNRLASEYHCILKANLTNWLHVRDTISVWKRTKICPIIFAADSDNDDGDEDEEIAYHHIPVEERLPAEMAAPCVAYLLDHQKK